VRSGYQASIRYVTRATYSNHRQWVCEHVHRDEISAFACASRETRRRFATTTPRTTIAAFNVTTRPVLKEDGEKP
jgi:hypothetical protein